MAPNYSLYAIPIYWAIAMVPHAYAVEILKGANNKKWDNANPRGLETNAKYQKTVPAEVYSRFERAEASHKNMLENAPLLIGAVIVGNMMGLPASTMNTAIGSYLALRVAYIFAYINITRQRYSYIRSMCWAVSTGILFRVFWKARNKLVAQG